MPCRDYSDEYRVVDNTKTYKELRDKLARIACKALGKLESMGVKTFDEETTEWWTQHKLDDIKAAKEKARMEKELIEKKRRMREERMKADLATLKKLQAKYGRNV